MSGRYGQIYASQLARWAGWTGEEIAVAVYLRASKHASTEGLAEIPAAYIAHDRRWDVARVDRLLDRLVELGDIERYADWVLVLDALEQHSLRTPNHFKGAASRLQGAPVESALYGRFCELATVHCPGLAELLPDATGMAFGSHADASCDPSPSTSPSPSPTSSPISNSTAKPASPADARTTAGEGPAGEDDTSNALWVEQLKPEMERVSAWSADISRSGDAAVVALLRGNADAPWVQLVAKAVSQALLPDDDSRRLKTPKVLKALELKLDDHRRDNPPPTVGAVARLDQIARDHQAAQLRQAEEDRARLATAEGQEEARTQQAEDVRLNSWLDQSAPSNVLGLRRAGQ